MIAQYISGMRVQSNGNWTISHNIGKMPIQISDSSGATEKGFQK